MKFNNYFESNKILLAIFPPHTTHTLQPLDAGMFSPLAKAYSTELASYLDRTQGLCSITKRDFFQLFSIAWSSSFTSKNILSAFRATRVALLNLEFILQRFKRKEYSRPGLSGSQSLVLSASDLRKIERLLRTVVADIQSREKKKLSATIYTISAQKTLLQDKD
jgi:hypothetical protein